jgi:succinoglycan biosynthesis transport protein ExoP
MGGLILGAGIGMVRDISDRVFRTTDQVEKCLQTDCITVVPLVKAPPLAAGAASKVAARPPDRGETAAYDGAGMVSRDHSLLWTIVDSPFSRFAESIRAIKVAADLGKMVKSNSVIGITSALPNEGKSTIATALSELISHGGGRAVLVDCDLRNPSLSRKLAPNAEVGLLDLVAGKAFIDEVVWIETATGLAFLPTVVQTRLVHTSEILASEAMRRVFEKLRETYDYVIVDLAPLAPVVDVRAMTHLMDSFVFVIEWGRTKIDVAEHALSGARGVYENLLGIVLNKTDMNTFSRYEAGRSNYYHNRYYARYGYTD